MLYSILFSAMSYAGPLAIKLHILEDGVYRLQYADLIQAGLAPEQPIVSAQMSLSNLGQAVPIWIEDGADGVFDNSDWLVFIGEHLSGETTFYHDYSALNVYWLELQSSTPPRRMTQAEQPPQLAADTPLEQSFYRYRLHLEQDRLLVPFAVKPAQDEIPTLWYWEKLAHTDASAHRFTLDLSDWQPASEQAVKLRVNLRGLSKAATVAGLPMADHQVDVLLNGAPVGRAEWQQQEAFRLELTLPEQILRQGRNELALQVPGRSADGQNELLIDISYLDWIEIDYPRSNQVESGQGLLWQARPYPQGRSALLTQSTATLTLYGRHGYRGRAVPLRNGEDADASSDPAYRYQGFVWPETEQALWVVHNAAYKSPWLIERVAPSRLALRQQQADYFMIAHASLIEAIQPLADFHRQRGLNVEIIDVQAIYDEFNFGIQHPRAIRNFLVQAYKHRAEPRPRFVLLVGDANWYTKQQPEKGTSEHQPIQPNLIPSWQYFTREGPAASDNPFVTFTEHDHAPAMAIGRFPVVHPEEARAVVAKTVQYMQHSELGPWRASVLLLSDSKRNHGARSQRLLQRLQNSGLALQALMPAPAETASSLQSRVREAFDQGQLLVHFFGHGGRYMWQTMSADQTSLSQLFDMQDLDQLKPNKRWPVVLSMTCSTAPFDHPTADSLGEKFLRMPDRGAVAVLAASARNSPSVRFIDVLMDELVRQAYLGEAIATAKGAVRSPVPAGLYNLLGDPALRLALPQLELSISELSTKTEIKTVIPAEPFSGHAIIDWLDEGQNLLMRELSAVNARQFVTAIPRHLPRPVRAARIYVWDPGQNIDGMGAVVFAP